MASLQDLFVKLASEKDVKCLIVFNVVELIMTLVHAADVAEEPCEK